MVAIMSTWSLPALVLGDTTFFAPEKACREDECSRYEKSETHSNCFENSTSKVRERMRFRGVDDMNSSWRQGCFLRVGRRPGPVLFSWMDLSEHRA